MRSCLLACVILVLAWPLSGRVAERYDRRLDVAALSELGKELFFEPALSASGTTSCASCHDPRFAFGPPNALSVQLAGRDGRTPGVRAAPSLRYLQTLPPFGEHFHDDDGDDSIDAGPTGGHMWDGRAGASHEQARLPLLSPSEMANTSPAEVVARLRGSRHASRLRAMFGEGVFDDGERVFDAVLLALEVYQQSPREFYPYSSRYDEVLRGRATLSRLEARGLALFADPDKGNCSSCHRSEIAAGGAFPLFTDFSHIALGAPRHRGLAASADPTSFDLGLCGPLRTDLRGHDDYCGRFRTPTLRNVAVRQVFFHNGVFRSLDEVVRFYARRDTHPGEFYPAEKYDDLPPAYRANVNGDPPFGRRPGERPALDDDEIAAVVAFLRTLTDADLAR